MNKESLKIGLKVHRGKTKFMTNIDTTDKIQIDGTEIEEATNYQYLAQTIAMKNKARILDENKSRVECFWKVQRNLSGQDPSHERFDGRDQKPVTEANPDEYSGWLTS